MTCEHPVYMDGRCYDCGDPHPADCPCSERPIVPVESLPVDLTRLIPSSDGDSP